MSLPFTGRRVRHYLQREQLLLYAAAAEQRQSHPIARAFLAAAQSRQLALPSIDHATYKIGYGLSGLVDQHIVHVGSARYMDMEPSLSPLIWRNCRLPASRRAIRWCCRA